MQKVCAIVLLSVLVSNYEALPQTKWSRPTRHSQGQLTRERRQFPFGEWIPLSQPCPTCRPFADPLDAGLRGENIGLTPPRPPTVTRQIHGEGNFFSQDESSILSVPPPPPSAIPRHPISGNSGNFQFSSFGQQFNTPLGVPSPKVFPQTQQIQFLPQTFLSNQPLLVSGNQQILSGLNAQNNLFGQGETQQQINNGKVTNFNSEFKTQKLPENVVLEQNKKPVAQKQTFSNKPQPFTPSQQNQHQTFGQQQSFGNQQQQSVSFGNSVLTPPPAPKNISQEVVIPGLDKEEIQLLYVPVETLRERGTPQEQQLLTQQNIQLYNKGNGLQRPINNVRTTEQTFVTQGKAHFVTQNGKNQGQADSSITVTSTQPFSTSVTPSSLLLQHLPLQQTPQPFVSATPITPTIQPFVTPASVFQKFSPFTPETTLPHLSTVPNTVRFSQSDIDFGTTPKTVTTQDIFKEEIITGKPQFPVLKSTSFSQEEERPLQQHLPQPFVSQQHAVTQQPQLNTVFSQQQQKELLTQSHFPQQINQQQIALQKQQEHQRFLQQQRQKELEEQRLLEQQKKQKELEEQGLLLQQRQKELEQQRFLQKQKELEEQRLFQQQQQKELEQQRFLQKQKELAEQRLLQQRQKELEQQRLLQKQKELEEQRLLQQRQKELEQQRLLQKQKELEEQRLLQQRQKELEQQRLLQKQKELEEQRFLQQRQKELEEQRFLQEQRQKELENQRRLQLQKQRELDEKRRLQLKQKEEEQRILRVQQQQKELEQQRLLKQQEEQQHLLQQQNQENLKKQQQFQFFQQQQNQQKQTLPQQAFHQTNRHVLPANDKLNFIPQLEKESEPEDQQLVPHQPPLSVFFKGFNGAEARITDVLRELRSSNTITVLDQYFEKMPKVFVGPAGLIPPPGYGKFELPYLSNLESNRIEKRIDKLPFFVAPLNFVPPPGYAKIPFPAPHIGSVVVSSESNPAMSLKSAEKGSVEQEGSFPVVGPELPGLINNLDTVTTTVQPSPYASTPSLPQTTAQLRNRRPSNSLYKPQSRKPLTRTRPTTTSKPEEVTQPIQKTEDSESGFRKPFNRFLNRRRQQSKTTTESPLKERQDGKSLENRHYSVEVYHQDKYQLPKTQQKSDAIEEKQNDEDQFEQQRQFEQHTTTIDRITPSDHKILEIKPTPDFSETQQTGEAVESEERRPEISDYSDINLQTFEDGPLPTGSAKTITQELYRPNAINPPQEEISFKTSSEHDSTPTSVKYQPEVYESESTTSFSGVSGVSPTVGYVNYQGSVSEEQTNVQPTSSVGFEKEDGSAERYQTTETPRRRVSFTPDPVTNSGEQHTKAFFDSNEQYTSTFDEISKPHHTPDFVDSSGGQQSKFSDAYPTPEISVDLQAPFSQKNSQEFEISDEAEPTQNFTKFSDDTFRATGSSGEQYFSEFEGATGQQALKITSSQVTPTAPGATGGYATDFSVKSQQQNSAETNKNTEDERIGSFISLPDIQSTAGSPASPQKYSQSSGVFASQVTATENYKNSDHPIIVEQNYSPVSLTSETVSDVTVTPSIQTSTLSSVSEGSVHVNEQTLTLEGHGPDVTDNLSNSHRLKLTNPSIVRVRTRVRNKSRGQVNFAASQSTTPVSFTRSAAEIAEPEYTTRNNHLRDYNLVKTSKYNQYRGVKKPVRTTTEATTEFEQKANVYTIRPQRRPLNPSTVSTKRIRKPTSPLPSVDTATEVFGISTVGSYSPSEHSDFSSSGVSNDVYYEQSSLSPVKHKLRKHFGSAEQKNDFVPAYVSSSHPYVPSTYSTFTRDEYSEESYLAGKDFTQTAAPVENPEKYPEWNPSESGFDVSGVVLTTVRTQSHEDQSELEEPKKSQDNKKAFDPDLEKKTGRRRVRVRVHKRPHENFETAESQNLRTVANVLVPPTTTYKPNDESNFHQLAKNADFSFGSQKLFGIRSREYFKKRLNLTEPEITSEATERDQVTGDKNGETTEKTKVLGFVRKVEKTKKNDFEISSNETGGGEKIVRPKFRGFVRKIIKHGPNKEADSESNQVPENDESEKKPENSEIHLRQPFRINQGSFNYTGRVNGTRHKAFVRFVKKNKIKHYETESHQDSRHVQESEKEEPRLHETTEAHTVAPENASKTTEAQSAKETTPETQSFVSHSSEETPEPQLTEATTEPEVKQTQQPLTETTQMVETSEDSSQTILESNAQPVTPLTQLPESYITQRHKFYQTLRPAFQRTTVSGFQRSKEPQLTLSTTAHSVQEPQEKRNGFSRLKYGKTTGFGSTNYEKSEENNRKVTEQQLKSKNLHTLEVRKYLRTKSREGAFSQFSKNKYFTSAKSERVPVKNQENVEKESEEITEEIAESTSVEPKTTQVFESRTDSTETEEETTESDEDSEHRVSTTESIISFEEESSKENKTTSFVNFEVTTETEIPTSVFQTSSSETPEKFTEPKLTPKTTEETKTHETEYQPDIYRFSKNSFSFDEAEKFTGTKNRAHVRNITADIIENTASFSAPGVEKRPDIRVIAHRFDEQFPAVTDSHSVRNHNEKTEEATTDLSNLETTTDYLQTDIETTASTEAATKSKVAKILKTSTTTKISHETEICYKGKCIRTKSENPDEDLKLLVDSASTMKIEKMKT